MDAEQAEESIRVVADIEEDFDDICGFQYLLDLFAVGVRSGESRGSQRFHIDRVDRVSWFD